ncbi:Histone deacetylase [Bertholletia excelsa]
MCTGSSSAVETSSSRNFNTYPKISSEVEFYQASSYLTCLPPGFLLSTRLPMTSPFTALRSCTHLILLNGVASASFLSWMDGIVDKNCMVEPLEAAEDDLLVVHTESYLKSLESSLTVSKIVEVPPVAQLPNILVQQKVLQPLRVQVGGTILAAKLAKEWGCAVNIGGGFHHCSADKGGGFCVYADISLCIHFAFLWLNISRVMIIDLDAHQGNGHEKDFSTDRRVYILDMYNPEIYPFDFEARRYIDRKIEVASGTATNEYLEKLDEALEVAGCMFDPELVIYNAGTDILDGDPLGMLKYRLLANMCYSSWFWTTKPPGAFITEHLALDHHFLLAQPSSVLFYSPLLQIPFVNILYLFGVHFVYIHNQLFFVV